MKYLTVDIGNTRTKAVLYENGQTVRAIDRIEDLPVRVDRSISSATGWHEEPWMQAIAACSDHHIVLDHNTAVPITNRYATPETLGRDRLAAVCGAQRLYPEDDCLIVDAGTCITYDYIDHNGIYHGGNIAPGLEMRLQAMHDYTDRLPKPPVHWHESPLGSDTASALQNGAIYGIKYEIEGLCDRLSDDNIEFKLILTGGDAAFLSSTLERGIFEHPNLVMIGLLSILEHYDV